MGGAEGGPGGLAAREGGGPGGAPGGPPNAPGGGANAGLFCGPAGGPVGEGGPGGSASIEGAAGGPGGLSEGVVDSNNESIGEASATGVSVSDVAISKASPMVSGSSGGASSNSSIAA